MAVLVTPFPNGRLEATEEESEEEVVRRSALPMWAVNENASMCVAYETSTVAASRRLSRTILLCVLKFIVGQLPFLRSLTVVK